MITEQHLYEDYVKEYGKKYSFEQWFSILSSVLNAIIKQFIYEKGVWVFPIKIGFISLIKINSRNTIKPLLNMYDDLPPAAQRMYRIKLNVHTFGYMFRTKWDKRPGYTLFKNWEYYNFKWYPRIKSMISKYTIESHENRNIPTIDAPLRKL